MTVGNLIALRQTNVVRLFAYSSVAQAGFILAPLAVVGEQPRRRGTTPSGPIVSYLIIYTAMNLGAFARDHRRGPQDPLAASSTRWGGLFEYAPGLAVAMAVFLFALAGIPPLGGWFAKFQVFKAILSAGGTSAGYARGRDRRRELGDRALLLRQHRPGDVVRAAARRRPHAVQVPGALALALGVTADRHPRVRLLPRPGRPLRRRRHRPRSPSPTGRLSRRRPA